MTTKIERVGGKGDVESPIILACTRKHRAKIHDRGVPGGTKNSPPEDSYESLAFGSDMADVCSTRVSVPDSWMDRKTSQREDWVNRKESVKGDLAKRRAAKHKKHALRGFRGKHKKPRMGQTQFDADLELARMHRTKCRCDTTIAPRAVIEDSLIKSGVELNPGPHRAKRKAAQKERRAKDAVSFTPNDLLSQLEAITNVGDVNALITFARTFQIDQVCVDKLIADGNFDGVSGLIKLAIRNMVQAQVILKKQEQVQQVADLVGEANLTDEAKKILHSTTKDGLSVAKVTKPDVPNAGKPATTNSPAGAAGSAPPAVVFLPTPADNVAPLDGHHCTVHEIEQSYDLVFRAAVVKAITYSIGFMNHEQRLDNDRSVPAISQRHVLCDVDVRASSVSGALGRLGGILGRWGLKFWSLFKQHTYSWWTPIPSLLKAISVAMYLVLKRSGSIIKETLHYSPHLLTGLVTQARVGTSPEVFNQNVHQHVLRHPGLPIPDVETYAVYTSTERLAPAVISSDLNYMSAPQSRLLSPQQYVNDLNVLIQQSIASTPRSMLLGCVPTRWVFSPLSQNYCPVDALSLSCLGAAATGLVITGGLISGSYLGMPLSLLIAMTRSLCATALKSAYFAICRPLLVVSIGALSDLFSRTANLITNLSPSTTLKSTSLPLDSMRNERMSSEKQIAEIAASVLRHVLLHI